MEDIRSIKNFKEWSDVTIDENFSSILSSYLMSNSESEVIFLKEFDKKEVLQNFSVQSLFPVSFNIRIENKDEYDNSKLRKWHDPIANYIKEVVDSRFQ